MHTLTAVDPKTGNCIPLISLLAAANHHDSHFLALLGNAIGLNIKLVSADQAYHDKTSAVYAENGSHLVKLPNSKVRFPENVDPISLEVTCDDFCKFPMEYIRYGRTGAMLWAMSCPQFRHITLDEGCFQRILRSTPLVSQTLEMQKHCERPFNLLKKREGLEQLRVRSQHGAAARTTFATIANLLIELIKTRKTKKKTPLRQLQLPLAA